MNAINETSSAATWSLPRKRAKIEDENIDDDNQNSLSSLEYISVPGSLLPAENKNDKNNDLEENPLNSFIAGIQQAVDRSSQNNSTEVDKIKAFQNDIEEDEDESYYKCIEENPTIGLIDLRSDPEIEYDEDGNSIVPLCKKEIDPLPPIDHDEIEYEPFENFDTIYEEIANIT